MPKFTIIEVVEEQRIVAAESAQAALDAYLAGVYADTTPSIAVRERTVYDENGDECEVRDGS